MGGFSLLVAGKHARGLFPTWFWIGAAALAAMALLLLAVGAGAMINRAKLKQVQAELSTEQQQIDRLRRENQALKGEVKELKDNSKKLEQIRERVFQINERRESVVKWAALPDRGGSWVDRIDGYLAGTPLAGQGRTFYLAAVDAGIEPRLMPAIAMIESGGGRVNANTNNFFGRRARTGWMSWPTQEAAIQDQAGYIARMWGNVVSPGQMPSYAVPLAPWQVKVEREMRKI
jgi:cell division protein FtsB